MRPSLSPVPAWTEKIGRGDVTAVVVGAAIGLALTALAIRRWG